MKITMRHFFTIFTSISIVLIFSACNNTSTQITEPTIEEIELIKPIGDQIAGKLVKELQSELKAAIKNGGFEEAVNVCNLKAAPITKIISSTTNRKVVIKRTSNKYRNPMNAPDKFEKKALAYFEGLNDSGKPLPDYYIQKLGSGNSMVFNYYKPMKTGNKCLICHGKRSLIKPDILNSISNLYPNDKATGYNENDFRGLIRITIGN
jgi:hypothetical protein